ncbi:MAG: insulinase family protein, partial [Paludibacteraceae bacterium]|nr:insulinase family protein [Paludibacteraceae bacterium]
IINYMQNIGAKFGTNLNAYTSLDQTVYMLRNIPVPRPSVVDSGLLILHDWSSFISLESDEIDKERGVIREEWRTGSSAGRRLWANGNKIKYKGSQYAKRDVIGDTAIINNFPYDTLRAYYHKWYRPDLQAIVVVGDVNVDSTENSLKSIFADIDKPVNPAKRVIYTIPDNKEPIISVVTDPEADVVTLGLEFKKEPMTMSRKLSQEGYIETLVYNFICTMMNERLKKIAREPASPFVDSYVMYGSIARSKDGFLVGVVPKKGQEKAAFKKMLTELQRMNRFGFIQSELDRTFANFTSRMEKAYNERDKQNSSNYMTEYINHFLENEPTPGIEWEYDFCKKVMTKKINLQIINRYAQNLVTDDNLIVDISGPDNAKDAIPTEAEIKSALTASAQEYVKPYEEKNVNKPLLNDSKLKPGHVVKQEYNSRFGTTVLTLSNNVRVILKPTDFKNDEILMRATSLGGTSTVKDTRKLMSCAYATTVATNNGIGQFSKTQLNHILAGKNCTVSPSIGTFGEGLKGGTTKKDLETMLQLVHMEFGKPRKDDKAFAAFMNELRTSVANSEADPGKIYGDSVSLTLSCHSPRTLIVNSKTVNQISQKDALKFFDQRFDNAADFDFVFVGSFDIDSITPLLCKYLGSLKTKDAKENWVDNNVRYPKGNVTNRFGAQMHTKQTSVYMQMWANVIYNEENSVKLQALRDILSLRYTESLREEEGGTYGAHVSYGIGDKPQEQGYIRVSFDTDPKLESKLVSKAWEEIEKIAKEGPLAEDLSKTKLNLATNFKQNVKDNGWWLNILCTNAQDGLDYYNNYAKIVDSLTADDIKQVAQAMLIEKNRTEVIMVPKE